MNKEHDSFKKMKEIITDLTSNNALLSEKLSCFVEFFNSILFRLLNEGRISLKFDWAINEKLNF